MSNKEDNILFEKIKNNDKKAFEALFKKYYGKLSYFAYTFLNDKDTSEEIVQNVLINIWTKRKELLISATVQAYLYASVRNRSLNFIKKNKNFSALDDTVSAMQDQPEEPQLHHSDIQGVIKAAIDKLPTRCAQIFRLSRFEGLSYKEIAAYLDLSQKTVEAQMGIALKNLRKLLKPYYKKFKEEH